MKELGRDMIIITLKEPKWKQTDELDQGAKSLHSVNHLRTCQLIQMSFPYILSSHLDVYFVVNLHLPHYFYFGNR